MSRWINGQPSPSMWYGYTDLGPIQIPPLPRFIVLTDRADGTTLWWLTYSLSLSQADGYGNVSITTASSPRNQENATYAAYNEPYLTAEAGAMRLFVRGGVLGVEEKAPGLGVEDIENLPIYARQTGLNILMLRIILSVTSNTVQRNYGFTPFTIVQTPNPICPPPCT